MPERRALIVGGLALLGLGGFLLVQQQAQKSPGTPAGSSGCFNGWSETQKLQLIFTMSWGDIAAQYGASCMAGLVSWYAPYRIAQRGSFFSGWGDDQLLALINSQSWNGIAGQYGWPATSWLWNWYGPRRTS